MVGVVLLQAGLALTVAGLVASAAIGAAGIAIAAAGAALALLGALLPARPAAIVRPTCRLDEFAPRWHFGERHARFVAAPPARVYAAVRAVGADEVRFFRLLTWLRRGGRTLPPGILHAPRGQPLIDVAVRGGFRLLADEPPREIVLGLALIRGVTGTLNFLIEPRGAAGSLVTTETRVHATDPNSARRFAVYWRIIRPGSALIRRMWLRAIRTRATERRGS